MHFLPGMGQRIAKCREGMSISIDEVSRRLGISEYEASDLETSDSEFVDNLSLNKASLYCHILDVQIGYILSGLGPVSAHGKVLRWKLDHLKERILKEFQQKDGKEYICKSIDFELDSYLSEDTAGENLNIEALFQMISALFEDWRNFIE